MVEHLALGQGADSVPPPSFPPEGFRFAHLRSLCESRVLREKNTFLQFFQTGYSLSEK